MAGEPEKLLCNACGDELTPMTQAVAANCHHIFCTGCAKKLVEDGEACPLCKGEISRGYNLKLVTVLQPVDKCKLMLCGQTPEVVTQVALTAINFYVEQQRLSGMYFTQQLQQKLAAMHATSKKKIMELQTVFHQARQKLAGVMQQKRSLELDIEELQQKYQTKSSQTKKLHELFKAMEREKEELKRHNEQLKRHCGMGPTGTAGAGGRQVVASRQHGASGASARTALTPPFHGAAGTQMVTAVHTRATFDLTSPANSSMSLLGHGSAVVGPGSGTNMFAAAAGMLAGTQRPSTAGMFAPAALANGRNGGPLSGGVPGGGGNMQRLQSNAALFRSPAGGGFGGI